MEGILIPQQVFVGDTAEFLFPIDFFSSFDPSVLTGGIFQIEKIKQNECMKITEIKIKRQDKKEYISIMFIPWETGNISFPDLSCAGIYDDIPQVFISSILEKTQTEVLQPPRPPVLMPGTMSLLYSIAAACILFIFSAIFIFQIIRRRFFLNSFLHIQKKRVRILNKSLRRLQKNISSKVLQKKTQEEINLLLKNWLKEFEGAVRLYCFSLITQQDIKNGFNALTYSEVLFKLKKKFETSYGIYFEFEKIFLNLRDMRFGMPKLISADDMEKECIIFLNKIFSLVKIAEAELHKTESVKEKKRVV